MKETEDFPGGTVVKDLLVNPGDPEDMDLIPGLGRFPRIGNGNLLQYACLENPMDRGVWSLAVSRVTKSGT